MGNCIIHIEAITNAKKKLLAVTSSILGVEEYELFSTIKFINNLRANLLVIIELITTPEQKFIIYLSSVKPINYKPIN